MRQPPGFEDSAHPDYVCRLHKSIYGLKQSPRAWYSRLSDMLHQLGFVAAKTDTSLFVFHHAVITIYMLVYVDDIVVVTSCPKASASLIKRLGDAFPVKDLGPLHYFLGVEAVRDSGGMTLSGQVCDGSPSSHQYGQVQGRVHPYVSSGQACC